MLQVIHSESRRHKTYTGLLVLVAVCSLAISVATRYCSPEYSSPGKTSVAHKHATPEQSRQRLTKSTANWLPPVVEQAILGTPTEYQAMLPAVAPICSRFLAKDLYNRPPPSFLSIA